MDQGEFLYLGHGFRVLGGGEHFHAAFDLLRDGLCAGDSLGAGYAAALFGRALPGMLLVHRAVGAVFLRGLCFRGFGGVGFLVAGAVAAAGKSRAGAEGESYDGKQYGLFHCNLLH